MALFLLLRGGHTSADAVPRGTRPLGLLAGFADAVSGGGWSALIVTILVARGATSRTVIGTAHLANCVVSIAAATAVLGLDLNNVVRALQ